MVGSTTYQKYVPKIVRFDFSQREVWTHTFDESVTDFESIESIEVNADGDYVIAGKYDPSPDDVINI